MQREWRIDLDATPRRDLTEALYEAGNVWCSNNLPDIVNSPDTMECKVDAAQLADRLMYQIRQSVPAVLCLIGSLGGGPTTQIRVEIEGTADSGEQLSNDIAIAVSVVAPEETSS